MNDVQQWRHIRKGLITGRIVWRSDSGEWIDIELVGDHKLRYLSSDATQAHDGDVLRVRASFLTEVTP